MEYSFFAMLSRMKYIDRWALMRNTESENLDSHSKEVAVIAHALAVIGNVRFNKNYNAELCACAALFHDTSEILTGDLPTPVKYYNPEIKEAYAKVETVAEKKLLSLLPQQPRTQWLEQVSEAKKLDLLPAENNLTPRTLLKTVAKYCEADTVVATDVGQHQMWTMQYFPFRSPRTLLTSGGLGTMGFGLGAAIGGCIANDRKRTVLFTGDGSFGMCLQELATAVSQNLPLLIVIFNNGVLGMVRQWQTMFYEKHYSSTTLNRKTDFPALAKAFGAEGKKVTSLLELENALTTLAPDTPTVLDCQLDMDEFVLPMIPPGGSVQDLVTRRN